MEDNLGGVQRARCLLRASQEFAFSPLAVSSTLVDRFARQFPTSANKGEMLGINWPTYA